MDAPPQLRSLRFRRERQASWQELERLLRVVNKGGVRRLTADEIMRLPLLYRTALSSLSLAREISLDSALVPYLEDLCTRAYFVVYGTHVSLAQQVKAFFCHQFPHAFRTQRYAIALAALTLLSGAILAYVLTRNDVDLYDLLVGEMAQDRTPAASTAALRAHLYEQHPFSGALTTFAAALISHNAGVAFFAFALGFLVGIPTLLLMFYNGLTVGAFVALYHSRGLGTDVWGWLLPHGITELLAISIAGGAGLSIGSAVLFPGARSRRDALRDHGRTAGQLVMGVAAMLCLAGLLEGIFRQVVVDLHLRYAIASITAAWWLYYFAWVGRTRGARPPDYATATSNITSTTANRLHSHASD